MSSSSARSPDRSQEEMGKSQREYYLREQLKAIRRELGEASETEAEITELRTKIEEAEHAGGGRARRRGASWIGWPSCRRPPPSTA